MRLSINLWGQSSDGFRNRRNLAFLSAIWSLVIWPNELLLLHIFYDVEPDLINSMLVYATTLAGTSIGAYLWSAHKDDKEKRDVGNLDNDQGLELSGKVKKRIKLGKE